MKWGECKLLALKKIDPAVNSLVQTSNTKDYLNAIIGVANRGLQDLSTTGKFINKQDEIYIPKVNPIECSPLEEVCTYEGEEVEYEAHDGKAYYFEIIGTGIVEVYEDGILTKSIKNDSQKFKKYKGITTATENLKLVIKGESTFSFKNVAIFKERFHAEGEVFEYCRKRRVELKEKLDQFYKIANRNDFRMEGDSTIIINDMESHTLDVRYYQYPGTITDETKDDYEMALDQEVANILPLYMASELVEDDDTSIAFYFRQQYDAAKAQLSPNDSETNNEIKDVWGW